MATTWTVLTRDPTNVVDGELGDYRYLTLVDRARDVGTWELSLPWSHPARSRLWRDGAGIVIERSIDGATARTVASGPVRQRRRSFDAQVGELATFYGVTDLAHLARRVAHPSPATAGGLGPYTPAYDARSGVAETVIKGYVSANAGTGALTDRAVPGLTTATDLARGVNVTAQARWANLLTLTRGLAARAGWGIQCVGLTFDVRIPTDRTLTGVEFSTDRGNLAAYELAQVAPSSTYVYVGGGGTGTGRTIVEGQAPAAAVGWGRSEVFVDRRDTTTSADLQGTITETLTAGAATTVASVTVVDTPTIRYGVDYELGDIVTARFDDVVIVDTIDQLTLTVAGDRTTIQPVIGSSDLAPGTLAGFFRRLRGIEAELEQLNTVQ